MMDYYNKYRNTKDKHPLLPHNIPGGPVGLNKHEHKHIKNNRQHKMLHHTPASADSHHVTHEQCPMQRKGPCLEIQRRGRDCSELCGEGNSLCFSARSIMIPETQLDQLCFSRSRKPLRNSFLKSLSTSTLVSHGTILTVFSTAATAHKWRQRLLQCEVPKRRKLQQTWVHLMRTNSLSSVAALGQK